MRDELTATEAAERLGVTRQTVARWIDDKRLKAEKRGRAWRIPEREIRRLFEEQEMDEANRASSAADYLERYLPRIDVAASRELAEVARLYATTFDALEKAAEVGTDAPDTLREARDDLYDSLERARRNLLEAAEAYRRVDNWVELIPALREHALEMQS